MACQIRASATVVPDPKKIEFWIIGHKGVGAGAIYLYGNLAILRMTVVGDGSCNAGYSYFK